MTDSLSQEMLNDHLFFLGFRFVSRTGGEKNTRMQKLAGVTGIGGGRRSQDPISSLWEGDGVRGDV